MALPAIDLVEKRVQEITAATRRELTRELERIEQERAHLTAGLDKAAEKIKATLTQLAGSAPVGSARQRLEKGKRVRRGAEALQQEAAAVYRLIRQAGAKGISGKEIRRRHPKIGQSIKGFLKKHGGHKVRTDGVKAATRYRAGD
jgi:hypothetical protein